MDRSMICDTVCKLASAGKRLPKSLPNGKDPYEGMCDAFCMVFGDRNISKENWEQAELNYIKGQTVFISPQYMETELSLINQVVKNTDYDFDQRGGLTNDEFFRRKRTASRLYAFTGRMMNMDANHPHDKRINIMDFLPSKEEGIAVGLKHGLTERELSVPVERGGQLLSIRAFMAEYYACKHVNKPFPYVLKVANHEVEWAKRENKAGNS